MKTAITLYYILCYSINLLNLCLLGFLYLRQRQSRWRHEFLFMFGLMVISLSLSMPSLFFDTTRLESWTDAVTTAVMILTSAGICLVTGSTPGYLHSLRPDRLGELVSRGAWVAAALLFTAVLTEILLLSTNRLILACFSAMVVVIAWTVGWFLVQVIRYRQEVLANPAGRVALTMSIATIVFLPLMAANDFLGLDLPVLAADSGQRIVIVPLFLAIWSVLLLRKNLAELAHPAMAAPVSEQTRSLSGCLDLSDRELQVLEYLVRGLSYEAIGDQLCISHSTVKTHVRRIYQKVGVSGKIALISRLKELNHPIG